jgi:ppGpp synthetase/RelA/SpoT-type nucleotidyltranferase
MKIPIEKQKKFIKEFESIRPEFLAYTDLVEDILKRIIAELGILAIVQKRTKGVDSFSTKIIEKDKYLDPLKEVTDLAGARIVVHFQGQVVRVCEALKGIFEVDPANSLDHKSRLKVNEFGYRSVHYIVTPKKDVIFSRYGLKVDEKFTGMKAEIQVRTLAEHIWADISHDRIYKTRLNIPEEWMREAARLSAILENADNTFAEFSQYIDAISNVYELQYDIDEANKEVEKLKTLEIIQEKRPNEGIRNVMNLISVYSALNERDLAKSLLLKWIDIMSGHPYWQARLKFEGNILDLTDCSGNGKGGEYRGKIDEAKRSLKTLQKLHEKNGIPTSRELSFMYYRYSCIIQNSHNLSEEALANISMARELMPENPLYLTVLTECMVLRNLDLASRTITQIKNNLEKDIIALQELIKLGIDAIPAWFTIGRSHFFLGHDWECIKAYTEAVSIIIDKNSASNCYIIDSEISRANRLKPLNEKYDKKLADLIILFLNLAMVVSDIVADKKRYKEYLQDWRLHKTKLNSPVVIVAGGAAFMDEVKAESYREYIEELMHDFQGTIISGGTESGIPGLVGRVGNELGRMKSPEFDLLAYLPRDLPDDAVRSETYSHMETDSGEFSVLDILCYWTDIILSGIDPSDVIIVGIEGGELADMEYRIGLSLGAKVCLLANSGRAATSFVQEKEAKNVPNLIELPEDPLTLWAIANQKKNTVLTASEIDKLAPIVHEHYRTNRLKTFTTAETDINRYKEVIEWEYLDDSIKNSNKLQVAFYEHILRRVGLGIRKSDNPFLINISETLDHESYIRLARLEHARWNAERLFDGWKYGPKKDLAKKINPYLVSWERLDDSIKPYDFEPVNNIPMMLSKIGYEVFSPGQEA